jgi:hypothetical protein
VDEVVALIAADGGQAIAVQADVGEEPAKRFHTTAGREPAG